MKKSAFIGSTLLGILFLVLASLLSACQPTVAANSTSQISIAPSAASTVTALPATAIPTATIPSSLTPRPTRIWLADYLPEVFVSSLNLPTDIQKTTDKTQADIFVDVITTGNPPGLESTSWVYALVASFPTLTDEITTAELTDLWSNGSTPNLPVKTLLVSSSTLQILEKLWGKASNIVKTIPQEQILDDAWAAPNAWAIIPFEQLEPRWKVLAIEGQSPIRKDFAMERYGLTVYFGLSGSPEKANPLIQSLPKSNRLADKMTTVVTTGVTALVRGTASLMKVMGVTYPARDIGDWLQNADILHISNEVPFAVNCPLPFDWVDLVFCSQTMNIELLEYIGTDVVELTGDHFKDWGPEAMLYTLDLYKERGWQYYGGGANADEASQPALFEHNGNRIAFTGCNAKEEGYSGADATTPGAIHCDFDKMDKQVRDLAADGYLPIVTFQHLEYYSYTANPILQTDFRRMADDGAVIVQGSQAHQPHAFEFRSNAFLHYGLGNLFFDQINQGDPPRTAFIDRHVFYNGRHISTELLTIYFEDYARSRPMYPEERTNLLRTVFDASGWTVAQDDN